jgi:hypothetical protein
MLRNLDRHDDTCSADTCIAGPRVLMTPDTPREIPLTVTPRPALTLLVLGLMQ